MDAGILAIFSMFIFIPFLICVTILVGIKKGKTETSTRSSSAEDAQAMRALYADQERLARRIEALETILIETCRQKQTPPPVPTSEQDAWLAREARMASRGSSQSRTPFS